MFYGKFEHVVSVVLSGPIAMVIVSATRHLAWNVPLMVSADALDPVNPAMSHSIFGMIFTVIIALEFRHSLLAVIECRESAIQVRAIVLAAILAVVRKIIILDMSTTPADQLFNPAAAILALGLVFWLVRDQDRREGFIRRSARREMHPPDGDRGAVAT